MEGTDFRIDDVMCILAAQPGHERPCPTSTVRRPEEGGAWAVGSWHTGMNRAPTLGQRRNLVLGGRVTV